MTIQGLPSREVLEKFKDHNDLKGFLNVVFRQVDTEKFMKIYCDTVNNSNLNNEGVYQELLKRSKEAKGNIFTRLGMGLKALTLEVSTLKENLKKVLDPNKKRDGYVEIAMPGRMIKTMKSIGGVTGQCVVVNENESLLQAGFPRPYKQFQTLTYDPLNLPKDSADVVGCFAGLHHCTEEKLGAFLDSIHATLREGGLLLLREHDTHDTHMHDVAMIVHSVFNCNTDVPLKDEVAEVRNFKSVNEWVKLVESKGFRLVSSPLIREGDTSENALLKFVKVSDPTSDSTQQNIIREKLISEHPHYTRDVHQSFLTRVEWLNVDSSKNLGNERYKNFWEYPYFKEIGRFFTTYLNSANEARKISGVKKVLKSQEFFISTFIFTATTIEYLAKGLLYAPINLAAKISHILPHKKADINWEKPAQQYQKWFKDYANRLDKDTFYSQKYLKHIRPYWSNLKETWKNSRNAGRGLIDLTFDRHTINNVLTGIVMCIDMIFRGALATIVNTSMGGQENADQRTIGVIVKGHYQKSEGDTVTKQIQDEQSEYEGLVTDRYKGLEACLKKIAQQGLEVTEIAGQKVIQMELLVDTSSHDYDESQLYAIPHLGSPDKKFVILKVPVGEIKQYINLPEFYRVYDF